MTGFVKRRSTVWEQTKGGGGKAQYDRGRRNGIGSKTGGQIMYKSHEVRKERKKTMREKQLEKEKRKKKRKELIRNDK